jgi:Bifunctional DNA primase/polymerase, N-terminal/Primase C terminal 2 (PriCT-2)/Protein of unknown function (DUF3987)
VTTDSCYFSSPLDAALRYAAIGWPVFPCKADKKPYTQHGYLEATTDPEQIDRWWRRWPDAQVGVATGLAGLCVIDLDVDATKGKDGMATFALLENENGPHWCGLIASSPRGGRHLYYLMPDPPVQLATDIPVGLLAAGTIKSGVDVRAGGGYVVVPSPASPRREWVIGSPFDVDDAGEADVGQLPAWLEGIIRGDKKAASAPSAAGDSAAPLTLGGVQIDSIKRALQHIDADDHDTWIRVAMALKSTGAREQAYEIWTEWSATSPRWASFDPQEHDKRWRSLREFFQNGREITIATLFHLAKAGGYVPSLEDEMAAEATTFAEPAEMAQPIATKRPFPRELMNGPGLLFDIAEWMAQSSKRPQHAMCLASALVTMGTVMGRKVATPSDLRTNVYCLGIGETGCGKDPGVRLPHALLNRAGLGTLVGPGEWKSDSGLRAALIDAPSHAVYCDEFTKLLDQMSGRQVPPHLKGIKRYLLEMWAASNSVHLSPAYANRQINKPVEIEQPNLSVYGCGVPSELFSSLDRGALSDGFLNRILVFWADDQLPAPQKVGRVEPPPELVERLAAMAAAATNGDLATLPGARPNARVLEFTAGAQAMLDAMEAENDRRVIAMRARAEPLSDLWIRLGAHVAKLALIRAASDDTGQILRPIDESDVDWARQLVVWCLERTMIEAESRVADSAQESLTKRVLRLIADAGAAGITASALSRRTQWLRRSDRKDIVATLVEGGQVVSSTADVAREGRGTVPVTTLVAAQHVGGQHFNASNASKSGLEVLESSQAAVGMPVTSG